MNNSIKYFVIAGIVLLAIGFALGWNFKPCPVKYVPAGETIRHDTTWFVVKPPDVQDSGKGNVTFRPYKSAVPNTAKITVSDKPPEMNKTTNGGLTFMVNIFDGVKVKQDSLTINELTNNALSKYVLTEPFKSVRDTIINGNKIHQEYYFPEDSHKIEVKFKLDSVRIITNTITKMFEKPTPWYDETWARIGTHAVAIILTAYIMKK